MPGLQDSEKSKLYFFTAFIFEKELFLGHSRFPDMTLRVSTLQQSDPPVKKIFRVVRPVKPRLIKEAS
jgi:hypothetical protein